jgi:hypothetical protein
MRLVFGLMPVCMAACGADRIIGLLVLPQVFGGEACVEFSATKVDVHGTPGGKSVGALRVRTPWRAGRDGGCDELVVEYRGERGIRVLQATQEYGYEMRAAVVFEARAGSRWRA